MTERDSKPAPKFLVPRPGGGGSSTSEPARPPSAQARARLSSLKPSRPPPRATPQPEAPPLLDSDELELIEDETDAGVLGARAAASLLTADDDDEETAVTDSAFFSDMDSGARAQPDKTSTDLARPRSSRGPVSAPPMSVPSVRPPTASPPPPPEGGTETDLTPPPPPTQSAPPPQVESPPSRSPEQQDTTGFEALLAGDSDSAPAQTLDELQLSPAPGVTSPVSADSPFAVLADTGSPPAVAELSDAADTDRSRDGAPSTEADPLAHPEGPTVGPPLAGDIASLSAPPLAPPPLAAAPLHASAADGPDFGETLLSESTSAEPAAMGRPKSKSNKMLLLLFGLLAIIGAALFLSQRSAPPGELVLTVSGPGGVKVTGLTLLVDDEHRCQGSPCRIKGLTLGTHFVKAEVKGYPTTAQQAVLIEAGKDTVFNLQLEGAGGAQLLVTGGVDGLKISVDGKPQGSAPFKLAVEAGKHVITASGDGLETLTQTFSIESGEQKELGPLLPQLLVGHLEVHSEGPVEVTLNGKTIHLPFAGELDATKQHVLVARRAGHARLEKDLTFTAASPEIELDIDLRKLGDESLAAKNTSESSASPRAKNADDDAFRAALGRKKKPATNESTSSKGKATLNLDSSPPSTILLDGTPLGKTPKRGVSVKAGTHSVTFMHPKHGRKNLRITVKAGATKSLKPTLQ